MIGVGLVETKGPLFLQGHHQGVASSSSTSSELYCIRLFAFSLLTAHPFQTAATLMGAGLVIN